MATGIATYSLYKEHWVLDRTVAQTPLPTFFSALEYYYRRIEFVKVYSIYGFYFSAV
jgi:hypothetical protein